MENLNEEELLKQLNEAKKERAKKCNEIIENALKEYNCKLNTNIHVVINGELIVPVLVPN